LIAVIFMSVMLAFGLALGSLSYKQQVLASSAVASQYAFYAADAALECTLYADQHDNTFDYNNPSYTPFVGPGAIICGDSGPTLSTDYHYDSEGLMVAYRLKLDGDTRCADVTVYKDNPASPGFAHLFAQGYDVPCATLGAGSGARVVTRGINVQYSVGD
jgi:hypothetical protein